MSIYEKTTRELMHEFAEQMPPRVFSKQDVARWFTKNYPKIKSNTVMMHVEGMSINSKGRKHHPTIRANAGWDLFYKISPKEFRLWDPEKDPAPIYKNIIEAAEEEMLSGAIPENEEEADSDVEYAGARTFAFERDLQSYLVKNLPLLESGLHLYEDEDRQFNGIEFPVGQRYIDILAVGSDGAFVVIETKVSRAYDRVIGQLLRYMGWIKENVANGMPVRGIIVASEISTDLKLAASLIENVKLVDYEISFSLKYV